MITHHFNRDKTFWWLTLITNGNIFARPRPPQCSQRSILRKHFDTGFLLPVFDSNLLILSCYMLHPHTVFQFGNQMSTQTMVHISEYTTHVYLLTAPPRSCLFKFLNKPPLSGFIFQNILFGAAILATFVSFLQLCWYLKR